MYNTAIMQFGFILVYCTDTCAYTCTCMCSHAEQLNIIGHTYIHTAQAPPVCVGSQYDGSWKPTGTIFSIWVGD